MRKIILILFLCALKIHAQERMAPQNCNALNKVTENFTARGDFMRRAASDLTSASFVADKNSVAFVSGNSITLTNGFYAAPGSVFKGYIGNCETEIKSATDKVKNLQASPNPSSDIINLSLEHDQIIRIILVAMDGKTVFDKYVGNENAYSLEISQYPKGVYLLAVETNTGNRHTEKIIVQ